MTASSYPSAIKAVLIHEGGFVNSKKDPGGPTNRGVTQRTLSAYRGRPVSVAEVKALTEAEAKEIYRKNYATPIRFNDLPAGLDYAVLDFAVNSGPARAAKDLQRLLKVNVDGVIGDVTVEAAKAAAKVDEAKLISTYVDNRLAWLKTLSTFSTFGTGWTSRVKGVKSLALSLAAGDPEFGQIRHTEAGAAKAAEADVATASTPAGKAAASIGTPAIAGTVKEVVDTVVTLPAGVSRTIDLLIAAATCVGVGVAVWVIVKNYREKKQDVRSDATATPEGAEIAS